MVLAATKPKYIDLDDRVIMSGFPEKVCYITLKNVRPGSLVRIQGQKTFNHPLPSNKSVGGLRFRLKISDGLAVEYFVTVTKYPSYADWSAPLSLQTSSVDEYVYDVEQLPVAGVKMEPITPKTPVYRPVKKKPDTEPVPDPIDTKKALGQAAKRPRRRIRRVPKK
jgi:hypothetical protein